MITTLKRELRWREETIDPDQFMLEIFGPRPTSVGEVWSGPVSVQGIWSGLTSVEDVDTPIDVREGATTL